MLRLQLTEQGYAWAFAAAPKGEILDSGNGQVLRLVGLQAGCHVVLELPDDATEDAVVEAALRRGVRVYALSHYRVDAPLAGEASVPAALVLGFGNVNETWIRRGVAALGRVLAETD